MTDQERALQVLGIAGSLRRGSYNRALLREAQRLAPEGTQIRIWDRLGEVPPYDQDVEDAGDPEVVTDLKRAIREADGVLFVTPEYNYGVPGVLKNAIDWASRPPAESPLREKPVSIMGATTGSSGTARAQLQLRQSFVFTRTLAMLQPEVLVARARERFDEEGNLTDETTRKFVRQHVEALADWIRKQAR